MQKRESCTEAVLRIEGMISMRTQLAVDEAMEIIKRNRALPYVIEPIGLAEKWRTIKKHKLEFPEILAFLNAVSLEVGLP